MGIEPTTLLLAAAWNMLLVALLFMPLEWAAPARPAQARWRPRWRVDLAFFLGQQLVFGALVTLILAALSAWLAEGTWWQGLRKHYAEQPLWLQTVVAVSLGDLLMYGGHRLQHENALLWRFHSIHHTAETVDYLAAYREHPLDGLYTQTLMNLPAIILGLPIEAIMGVLAFRSMWAVFIHSNVRLPLGPLRMLFGAPELHFYHHAKDRKAGNYANLAPWIDWIFGSYVLPSGEPAAIGIHEPHPQSYFALLLHPFLPRRSEPASSDASLAAAGDDAASLNRDASRARASAATSTRPDLSSERP